MYCIEIAFKTTEEAVNICCWCRKLLVPTKEWPSNQPPIKRFIPVTNPALVAHWPLAVAAVDMKCCRCLVQAGYGAARTQLDDLIGHVPQLESLQQVYVGHVPVLLKWNNNN